MYPNLIAHIQKHITIGEEDINTVLKHIRIQAVDKKEYLHREGQICRNLYFVEKGCLRMFFNNEKGTEQITQFAIENWWVSDYMSFDRQAPSPFSIQAVERSELVVIDHSAQEQLLKNAPAMERYFRIILQRANAAQQMRVKFFHDFSKEESYLHFTRSFPEFEQRIPQYMMASYLGLTPEYLSEIRKKIR